MKVNGLTTKGKVMDNPFVGKAVTAYCAGLAVCLFHKVTLIQPEVYLGNALLDIYHIKIICEYLWKDTTQQLLGLHDAKITNTYEIMCMRREGCNWVLRLTRKLTGYVSESFTKSDGHSESGSGLTHKLRRMTTRIFQMFHQSQKKSSAIVELMKQLKLRFAHVSQRIQLKKFVVGGK